MENDVGIELRVDASLPRPLYVQIRDGIRDYILSGRAYPGEKLPGERDIARELGVDFKIVRQAMAALVEEGLIYRRPQRGTIVAEYDEKRKNHISTGNIGITLELRSWFQKDILRGIQEVIINNGFHAFVCDTKNELTTEARLVSSLIEKGVDGMIMAPVDFWNWRKKEISHYLRMVNQGIPFVLVDRYIPEIDADFIGCNDYKGSYDAISYLIRLGHKKIGHVTLPANTTSVKDRLRGYEDALRDNDIDYDEKLVEKPRSIIQNPSRLIKAVENLIKRKVTAIFCVNYRHAVGVENVLRNKGFRIPDDISLIAFGSPQDIEWSHHPLTIVSQPSFEIGVAAAKQLIIRINSKYDDNQERYKHIIEPNLLVRKSTAPPRL